MKARRIAAWAIMGPIIVVGFVVMSPLLLLLAITRAIDWAGDTITE